MKLQTGTLDSKKAIAIAALLTVFYLVLPTGNASKKLSPENLSNDNAQVMAEPQTDRKSAIADTASPTFASTDGESLELHVEPLPEVTDATLDSIIAASPFLTVATDRDSVPSSEPDFVAELPPATLRPPGPSITRQIAEKTRINLIYKSSTGTRAAILNDEVVRQGDATRHGLIINSIQNNSVEIRPGL